MTQLPRRILRIKQVSEKTGLPKSSIYRLRAKDEFPPPIRLSEKAVGWTEAVIDEWIEQRTEATTKLRIAAAQELAGQQC